MRLTIISVGRAKRGPETELFDTYARRIDAAGRPTGLGPLKVAEVPQSRKGTAAQRKQQESEAILAKAGSGVQLMLLEETGSAKNSDGFAKLLANCRDQGASEMIFAIGGPDGFSDVMRKRADLRLALGPMTLSHGLARIVLAEQVYRALTILSGHPYHRS